MSDTSEAQEIHRSCAPSKVGLALRAGLGRHPTNANHTRSHKAASEKRPHLGNEQGLAPLSTRVAPPAPCRTS
jgi:hypothetical protein